MYIFVNAVKTLTSDVSASLFYRVRFQDGVLDNKALKQRLQAQIDSACAFGGRSVYDIVLCVYERFRVDG